MHSNEENFSKSTCETCCGNGGIVTDWELYMKTNDKAVVDYPECNGAVFTGREVN